LRVVSVPKLRKYPSTAPKTSNAMMLVRLIGIADLRFQILDFAERTAPSRQSAIYNLQSAMS
jgi:hypothetical protein